MTEGIKLFSNGAYWQAVWYTSAGRRRAKSLGSKDAVSRAEALRKCREIERTHLIHPGAADAGKSPTLTAWERAYLGSATDLKEGTLALKRQTFNALRDHFGDVRLDRITRAGAAAFRAALTARGISLATVARYIRDAKTIAAAAVAQDLLIINPFDRVSGSAPGIAKDWHYVSLADLERLLDAVPTVQWRALIGLCRLAGLRRGEALRLRREDVDEVTRTMEVWPEEGVEGTKQAHRTVPITPRLAEILREAIDAIPDEEHRLCWGISEPNLNRDVLVYLDRAKIPRYSKPFHTLRKNLESDWMAEHPAPAVCAWLGHTAAVAMKHYHRPTEAMLRAVTRTTAPQTATNQPQNPP